MYFLKVNIRNSNGKFNNIDNINTHTHTVICLSLSSVSSFLALRRSSNAGVTCTLSANVTLHLLNTLLSASFILDVDLF